MTRKFRVGDLDLDEDEYRTYLIVQEAIKIKVEPLEHELHGKDGNNGLQSKVARISGATKVLGTIVTGIILYIITINVLL